MAYMARRLLAMVPVAGFLLLFVFVLLRVVPGDPAAIIAGDAGTPEQLAQIREALALDQPLAVQFVVWLKQVLTGDFGLSIMSGLPVARMIGQRLEATVALATFTIAVSVAVAVPLGVIAAWRRNSWLDRAVMSVCVIGFSVPVFVVAYVLMLIFVVELRWLPAQGYVSPYTDGGAFLRHLALPVLALSLPLIGLFTRITRASMLEVLGEDHVRTARANGLSEPRVLINHALRNASLPILAVVGNGFALLIGGVVVTESVFNLPGVGRLLLDAVLARDFPVIQGVVLLVSAFYVTLNLVIDLAYAALDPRIA